MKTSLADPEAIAAPTKGRAASNAGNEAKAALKIAALSRNPETLKALRDYTSGEPGLLQLQIWPAEAAHLTAMVDQEHPDVLMLEGPGGRESEFEALETLLAQRPELTVILISAQQSPEFLLRALRVGVREVMPLPVTPDALSQVVDRISQRRSLGRNSRPAGRILALLPSKGGAGSTFLAANLASAMAAEGKRVCLIDLNFHFGEAALYIGEGRPPANVAEVLQQIQRLDGPLLESCMLNVAPNLWLLAAPDSPEGTLDVRPESIERLLNVARANHDYVILDLPRMMDANTIRALDQAEEIYLVMQMTLPFLRDASRLLQLFRQLGYNNERVHVLINRFEKGGDMGPREIEQALGVQIAKVIPNSFGPVAVAINQGRPILEVDPQNPVSRAVQDMAREIAKVETGEAAGWFHRLLKRKA